MKKILLFLSIILFIFVIVFLVFIVTKKQNQKAEPIILSESSDNWGLYKNSLYNYSVEYPSRYKVEEKNGEVIFLDYSDKTIGPWIFSIVVIKDIATSNIDEYINQKKNNDQDIIIDGEIYISDKKALSYRIKNKYENEPNSEKHIVFFDNNLLFSINLRNNESENERFLNSLKLNQ